MKLVVSKTEKQFAIMIFLLIAALAISSIVEQKTRGSSEVRPSVKKELSKVSVKKLLKDPSSAQWGDIVYSNKTGAVCGFVNAKNSFGGYTGMKEFVYFAGMASINDDGQGFEDMWNALCANQ